VGNWRRVTGLGGFFVSVASIITTGASTARANGEFDLSLGYAHAELNGSASPFDSRDGFRVEPRVSWAVGGGDHSPLRLGFGLGMSGFERRTDDDAVLIDDDGDVFVFDGDDVEALSFITPEFQISYRIPLGSHPQGERPKWFIEPGVGVGVIIGQYWVGESFGWWVDEDINEWDATIAGRPFLRAGYQGDRWVFGLEGSYAFGGKLHFTDAIEGDVTEWYAGGFFGVKW
jgi:hypothetical protein